MKLDKNQKVLFALVAFGIILFLGLSHLDLLVNGLGYIEGIIHPFIMGAAMAFIVNVPMRFFENKVFCKLKKGKRAISLITSILCIVGVVSFVCIMLIPELVNTLYALAQNIPKFADETQKFLTSNSKNTKIIQEYIQQINLDWDSLRVKLIAFLQATASGLIDSTMSVLTGMVQTLVNFVLGLVFAINLLLQKEKLAVQGKKILYAYLKEGYATRIIYIIRLANKAFSGFFSGQCLEAVILGSIIFVTMSILGLPYAVLIAILIGALSLIPIAGAMIACTLGCFLILMISPLKAVIFLIMFLVVQQLEGNLIYPHVVGNSVGLPSMWVLVAVTVGGNLNGVVGMIVSIPTCSVVYILLRESVYPRLKKKKISNRKINA